MSTKSGIKASGFPDGQGVERNNLVIDLSTMVRGDHWGFKWSRFYLSKVSLRFKLNQIVYIHTYICNFKVK